MVSEASGVGVWELFKKAPNSVLVVAGIVVIVLMMCVTAIIISGKSPSSLFSVINVIFSGMALLAGTGAFTFSAAAAKNAQDASEKTDTVVEQTNGTLTQRIHDTVKTALELHDQEVHGIPPKAG